MIAAVVAAVAVLRLLELAWAERNRRALLAQGGSEVGARHYPLFILLHGGWLAALLWSVPADARADPALLALFGLLQLARLWVILSLGRYWTTRIITLPDAPLVRRGPYRWLRHPNYLVVSLEIALLPAAFGAWMVCLLFSLANALLLAYRIRIEEQALAPRRLC